MATAFDYTSAFGQQGGPFGALSQGLQLGAQLAQVDQQTALREAQTAKLQQEMAANQAKLAQQAKLGEAYTSLVDKVRAGTWQPADFQNVALLAPKEQSEAAIKFFDSLSKDRQAQTLASTTQTMAALGSKNPEVGVELLNARAAGYRRQGNEDQAKFLETQAKLAAIDPAPVIATLGETLYGLPGGKDAVEALAKMGEARRAETLAPFKLRQETADAIIKEAQSRLAPEKFLADLNLTKEQINQSKAAQAASRAAAAASGAEARRKTAEAEQLAAGIIPVDKRPEQETKFRREYYDLTKGYQEVKSAYGRILAVSSPKTPDEEAAADLALVFNFMKMQDPGSTVNAGEFANAQNAAGVPDRIRNLYNNLVTGARLNPSQRKAFTGQAENLFKVAGQQEATVRNGLERVAKGYGLNTANIFLEAVESAPTAPPGPPPPAPIPTVGTPQSIGGAMPGVPGPEMPAGFRVIRR